MKLSYQAIVTLKHILTFSGEKEIDQKGQEVLSPRRLNGEEASQRRHFFKNTEEFITKQEKEVNEKIEGAKEAYKKAHKKKEKEADGDYEMKMINTLNADKDLLKELNERRKAEIEVEMTDKTKEVVKKYFDSWKNWVVGDDEAVETLVEALK